MLSSAFVDFESSADAQLVLDDFLHLLYFVFVLFVLFYGAARWIGGLKSYVWMKKVSLLETTNGLCPMLNLFSWRENL